MTEALLPAHCTPVDVETVADARHLLLILWSADAADCYTFNGGKIFFVIFNAHNCWTVRTSGPSLGARVSTHLQSAESVGTLQLIGADYNLYTYCPVQFGSILPSV